MCEALGLALSRGQHSWLAGGWVLLGGWGGVQAHGTGKGQAGEAQLLPH